MNFVYFFWKIVQVAIPIAEPLRFLTKDHTKGQVSMLDSFFVAAFPESVTLNWLQKEAKVNYNVLKSSWLHQQAEKRK